ncbi:lipoprotein [Hydrogenophaga pseudoflava]|uniref:LPS translocon maturation chaperone LptM n=1 Tax=Hydrogenophaga TaxID=47420 RepID=UPI000A0402A0
MSNKTIVGGRMFRCSAWSAVALLVASTAITGCGQKGPLYMPAPKASASTPAKPAPTNPANNAAPAQPAEPATDPAR